MPLALSGLSGSLTAMYSAENDEGAAALQYATAISSFWATGMCPFGNAVVNAAGVVSIIKPDIESMYMDKTEDAASQAKKVAATIDSAFLTLMTAGPAIQLSLSGFGKSSLEQELKGIYSGENTAPVAAMKEAMAIMNYTINSLVTGIIPSVPPVPVSGPIL